MSAPIAVASALVRCWTATYTRGLPGEIRSERIEEIHADLWEQRRSAEVLRHPAGGTAFEIFCRLTLGMPADVLWRLETGAAQPTTWRSAMNTMVTRIGLLAVTVALLGLVALGIGIVMGAGEWDSRREQVLWGMVFAVCPLLAVVGLWLSGSMPRLGLSLVVGGVVVMALVMFWMAIVIVPVGLGVIALAIKRSGLAIWPVHRGGASPA